MQRDEALEEIRSTVVTMLRQGKAREQQGMEEPGLTLPMAMAAVEVMGSAKYGTMVLAGQEGAMEHQEEMEPVQERLVKEAWRQEMPN